MATRSTGNGVIHGLIAGLAAVQADVRNQTSTIANLTETWQRQESAATEGRRVIHEKLDETNSKMARIEQTVAEQGNDVTEMRGQVDHLTSLKDEEKGTRKAHAVLRGVLIAVGSAVGGGVLTHLIIHGFHW